jgi:tetratricopeptide (TPR) repeat protein
MARHLPLGAGFKAWAALHLQGASYAYYSAEVHSAPLDLALAFGWAGALGFLLLLGRFLLGLRAGRSWGPERVALLGALGALGLHGLLDWDLSYGIFAGALWLGFGLMGTVQGRQAAFLPGWLLTALASLSLAGVVLLGTGDVTATLADRALEAGQPFVARQHAALATTVTPWNDLAWAALGQADGALREHDGALAALARAARLNPYEPWYAELQAQEAIQAGRPREAAAAYAAYVRLWPWEPRAYEEALSALMDLAFRADLAGDRALAGELHGSGRAILAALDRQKAKEPAHTPRQPMQVESPILRQARDYFQPR